jgi:L-ascorbate metabolism protein UlaG (beta-lactamase superfamily)
VILRYAGFTILTDPNFLHAGDHVHLGYGLTSERLTEPAINIEDLPPIDLCVLSHYHGDHFDQLVEEKLDKDLPIVTTTAAVAELEARNFRKESGLTLGNQSNSKKARRVFAFLRCPDSTDPESLISQCPT